MALDSHKSAHQLSIHFLDYLDLEATSPFIKIRDSLQYLDHLVARADHDHPDIISFNEDLYDVSYKLHTEYLSGRLESSEARLLELFHQEIDTLFGSLPTALQADHNLTLAALLNPAEPQEQTVIMEPALKPAVQAAQAGKKLKPKTLLKVLATCAALSLSGSDKPSEHPDGVYYSPEGLSTAVSTQVQTVINVPPAFQPPPRVAAPDTLESPTSDRAYQRFQQAPYPAEIIAAETDDMASRLQFVLRTPERAELFQELRSDPRYRDVVSLVALIESNLDPDAVSHSGAMGIMQDMGDLQGAFGDPDTVAHLATVGLMPAVNDARYNEIIALLQSGARVQRGLLLDYLVAQRSANTPFWHAFIEEQTDLIRSPDTAAAIAHQYLEDLQAKALSRFPIDDPLEALNFAVMSYNLGMRHLHTLRRLMNLQGVEGFNTRVVLEFMSRSDFREILREQNLGGLYNNYEEARQYLARYIAMQNLVRTTPVG